MSACPAIAAVLLVSMGALVAAPTVERAWLRLPADGWLFHIVWWAWFALIVASLPFLLLFALLEGA